MREGNGWELDAVEEKDLMGRENNDVGIRWMGEDLQCPIV